MRPEQGVTSETEVSWSRGSRVQLSLVVPCRVIRHYCRAVVCNSDLASISEREADKSRSSIDRLLIIYTITGHTRCQSPRLRPRPWPVPRWPFPNTTMTSATARCTLARSTCVTKVNGEGDVHYDPHFSPSLSCRVRKTGMSCTCTQVPSEDEGKGNGSKEDAGGRETI